MKLTASNMEFDFSAFDSAEEYDTQQNQCAGLKIVDFVAESGESQFFIEVKNYANRSGNTLVQANMDKRQEIDYRMLTDPVAAFSLEMGMKFKDSLLRWFASGKEFTKPIALLLVVNPPVMFQARDRERLIRRIQGYIPNGMNDLPEQYPKISSMFFDMPTISEAQKRYGISISLQ
jgi:hypothetical protein